MKILVELSNQNETMAEEMIMKFQSSAQGISEYWLLVYYYFHAHTHTYTLIICDH